MYYYVPHTGMFSQSTRAQSVARSTFGQMYPMAPRKRAFDDEIIYRPFRPYVSHASYDTSGSENFTRSEINRELLYSSNAMEDNYDMVNLSRSKDKDVLSRAQKAITPHMPKADQIPRSTRGTRSQPSLRRSQSLRTTRSVNVPSKQTYKTTTTLLPLDLSSEQPPSPYLTQAEKLFTNKTLREGSYQPLYSRTVRTSVSPERFLSQHHSLSRSVSPYRSLSRDSSPLPLDSSSLLHRTTRPVRKRPRPRVLASKRRFGNYYNRLLSRRATQPNAAEGKYWPYIDVEDIEDTYTGDLYSDTESLHGEGYTGDSYTGDSYTGEGYTYIINTKSKPDDSYYGAYEGDSEDIPSIDYVPFRPKIRSVSPERDYSKLSVVPYMPKRDPTKTSVADEIAFNAIVAASAERARKALERLNWDDYDHAGLVLSVEGEYKAPSSDIPLGFRYISRPLTLKEPISRVVSAYDSDNAFTKYMKDSQSFRQGVRNRLEEGYRALDTTYKSYVPAITRTEIEHRPPTKPYHKRLREHEGFKYGHSLELYPITSTESTLSLPSSREAIPDSHAIRLYDSSYEPSSKLSTFDKVQIKAALLGRKVDVVLPAGRRRPKSQYAQNKLREMRKEHREAVLAENTSGLRASKPVQFQLARRIWDPELSYKTYRLTA